MLSRFRYPTIRNGLVGHWRPSRGPTGNTLIDSVRGNHGTLTNGPTWTPSETGYALSFDGTDDRVVNTSFTGLTSFPITFSAWAVTNNLTGQTGILSLGSEANVNNYLHIGKENSVVMMAARNSGGIAEIKTGTIAANTWFFLAGVFENSSLMSLHLNGRLVGTSTSLFPIDVLTLNIGRVVSRGFLWNGLIDDAAIFNRAITQPEILTLYTAGRGALDQRINIPIVRGYTPSGGPAINSRNNLLIGCGF